MQDLSARHGGDMVMSHFPVVSLQNKPNQYPYEPRAKDNGVSVLGRFWVFHALSFCRFTSMDDCR